MPTIEVNLDVALVMNAKVKQGHSFEITLTYTDESGPVILTGTRKMVITNETTTYTFTPGSGLTQASNTLRISRTVAQNTLYPGYYIYEIRKDESGLSVPEYKGQFIVEPSTALPT